MVVGNRNDFLTLQAVYFCEMWYAKGWSQKRGEREGAMYVNIQYLNDCSTA